MRYFFISILFLALPARAADNRPERWYQQNWCNQNNGIMEFQLSDKTRCDCLTDTHAIEFDFGNKWAEAIGQALYYGFKTGKKAGIVMILVKESDRRYWIRLNSVIRHYRLPIDTWIDERSAYK